MALDRGAAFLFKLHALHGGQIVGGGFLVRYTALTAHLAWETFREENGASTYAEMLARIQHYRRRPVDPYAEPVGCLVQDLSLALLGPNIFLSPRISRDGPGHPRRVPSSKSVAARGFWWMAVWRSRPGPVFVKECQASGWTMTMSPATASMWVPSTS